jgi:rod shape-determining protein MreC
MLRLLEFLYQRRILGLFLLLQGLSLWLLFSYNYRYNSYFLNSSNRISGEVLAVVHNVESYFGLQDINAQLANENLALRIMLSKQVSNRNNGPLVKDDSVAYHLSLGKVVNSSYRKSKNFITLRINPEDSIKPGMGVISSNGVVGRVKSVSTHFATVVSLLNPNLMVSGKIKSNKALCTVQWDELSPIEAELKYVPRHLKLSVGDTVVTSGFNAVFPEGFPIGVVSANNLRNESAFYDARIRLLTDFTTIEIAYVVHVAHKEEIVKLEEELPNE